VQPEAPARKCSSAALLIVQADEFFDSDSHPFNNAALRGTTRSTGDTQNLAKRNRKNVLSFATCSLLRTPPALLSLGIVVAVRGNKAFAIY
jgi:hypothetical protein